MTLLATIGLAGCSGGSVATGGSGGSGAGGSVATGGSGGSGAGGADAIGIFECSAGAGGDGGALVGGLEACTNGYVHRKVAVDCTSTIADWHPVLQGRDGGVANLQCTTNADCTEKPNGYCVTSVGFGGGGMPGVNTSSCVYGCVRDSDCATGEACLCGSPVGTCVSAECRTDRDCATGACIVLGHLGATGCGFGPTMSLGCWKADMDCATGADCTGGSVACNGGYCESVPVCGRPFLVEGAPRRAEAIRTSEWNTYLEPEGVGSIDRASREVLAAYWTEMGLMEHASIAAFARFALELLALGAPPALLEATELALRDETHHARLCFGLANAYAGRSVGPGRLPVRGALASESPSAVVETAFLEACVGETCAAIEAAEAAERATDPAVRAVLRRIATDETRHAELGWRFVRWALGTFGADVRQAVARTVAGLAVAERPPPGSELDESDGEPTVAHGALPETVRRAVRAAALRDVVMPCARALLDSGCAVAA